MKSKKIIFYKSLITAITVLAVCSTSLLALGESAGNISGGTLSDISVVLIETEPNARLKSLGGAGIALSDNASLLYINPAFLGIKPYGRGSIFYGNVRGIYHSAYIEYIYPFATNAGFAAGAQTRINDASNSQTTYSFGIGVNLFKGFAVGAVGRAVTLTVNNLFADDYAADLAFLISPYRWLNLGIRADNMMAPELAFEETSLTVSYPKNLKFGLGFFHKDYVSLGIDFKITDYSEEYGNRDIVTSYGIEIFPNPALALRGGVIEDGWTIGLGCDSTSFAADYAFISDQNSSGIHYLQFTYRFQKTPSRKEQELKMRQVKVEKDELYLRAVRYYNLGEIAQSQRVVNEYVEKYEKDGRIYALERDIREWIAKIRKENFGKAGELKKDIMKDYYQGKIKQALVKLDNLKILAPNYPDIKYLEHLLNARVLLEQGQYEAAEEELIEALQIDPDSEDVKSLHRRITEVLRINE